ncbi:MBL fold metallo-hydrolase [Niveispirillum sp.]|uniref:MBL fold metallo-hydrolase n=1 Tax=Niveispirillum sp. TaxID=1917217 RepID=UPI001B7ABD88|nr:MBL fold metallo-hydrolase [Niveispirillum sp.]MBP7339479.1 MBL fold metallo-hydrolase [Niveispirillum sp.]
MRKLIPTLLVAALLASAPVPAGAAGTGEGVAFVTLGTGGGPRVQVKRSQPANALVVDGAVYLFDTGDGVLRQLAAARLPLTSVKAVFLSHLHIDHVGGLGSFIANRWVMAARAPIPVIGPPGTDHMVTGMVAAFAPTERAPLGLPADPPLIATVRPRDLAPGLDTPTVIFDDGVVKVTAVTNNHYNVAPGAAGAGERSYSFRMEAKGRSIVFTGDTGPSAKVEALAKGADLLVSEVMDRPAIAQALRQIPGLTPAAMEGLLHHMDEDHLTPDTVGRLAARAGVGAVVLTHLVPGLDSETTADGYVRGLSDQFKGPVTVADDLGRY